MADKSASGPREAANALGIIAAILCAFLGFDQGGWIGALIAAVLAFGGVHLAFAAVGLALRLAAGAVVLLLMLATLKNRWDWLAGLFQ